MRKCIYCNNSIMHEKEINGLDKKQILIKTTCDKCGHFSFKEKDINYKKWSIK